MQNRDKWQTETLKTIAVLSRTLAELSQKNVFVDVNNCKSFRTQRAYNTRLQRDAAHVRNRQIARDLSPFCLRTKVTLRNDVPRLSSIGLWVGSSVTVEVHPGAFESLCR